MFVVSELEGRRSGMGEPSHIINIDIQDNHEEATIGAFMICDLCAMVCSFDILAVQGRVIEVSF